jgi:DinB family protein
MTTPADGSYRERMIAFLGEQDWRDALIDSARKVETVVRSLGPAGLERPHGPGKWKGKQVLAHLADAEIAVGFRFRQILSQQPHTIQEFDESAWMSLYDDDIDVEAALQSFLAARRWNHHLFSRLTAEQLSRVATHPARGDESLEMGLKAFAGHTYNHLCQLEKL